jgi:Protein of unknown function with PCYCGC motif
MRRDTTRTRRALLLAGTLLILPSISGCGSSQGQPTWTAGPQAAAQATAKPATTDTAREAAWAARPVFARSDARTEEAYAFALAHPNVLKWIPCYCGCGGMGHTSNLDCYFRRTAGLSSLDFEEHASYCQICVDETLMVKQLLADGHTLRDIRDAIDARFADSGPGTSTELPPV